MAGNKLVCTCCGNERRPEDYYASTSPFHKQHGKLHVCKLCIWNHVESKKDDLDFIKSTLRSIDKPFQIDLWKSSIQESKKVNKDIFKIYMKNLGLPHNRELTWDDSDFQVRQVNSEQNPSLEDSPLDVTNDELNDLVHFFGRGFSEEDYVWLQMEYEDFLNRYECDSKGMELLIKEICLTELDIKIRRSNKEKVDQQLKTLQDLLGSSNLKPVQETGANAVEQETFGTLIKKYENDKPIPEPDEKWKDVDGITKYIRIFFTGHLARMLGVKNDFEDEYWEEINKFTVEEPTEEENEELDDGKS